MTDTLDEGKSKTLLRLCREGRLFEVQEWIRSGRSIRVHESCKHAPLQVAIDCGFHSLVEVLLRAETDIISKNQALHKAVLERRLDLMELAVQHGAEVSSVDLIEVFYQWNPKIIGFFIDRAAKIPITSGGIFLRS